MVIPCSELLRSTPRLHFGVEALTLSLIEQPQVISLHSHPARPVLRFELSGRRCKGNPRCNGRFEGIPSCLVEGTQRRTQTYGGLPKKRTHPHARFVRLLQMRKNELLTSSHKKLILISSHGKLGK